MKNHRGKNDDDRETSRPHDDGATGGHGEGERLVCGYAVVCVCVCCLQLSSRSNQAPSMTDETPRGENVQHKLLKSCSMMTYTNYGLTSGDGGCGLLRHDVTYIRVHWTRDMGHEQ